jgi:hypothetical protein
MDAIVAMGAGALGLMLGVLTGWLVRDAKTLQEKVIGTAIFILAGAGVLNLITGSGRPTRDYWFYPLGLLIGFLIVLAVDLYLNGYRDKKPARRKR